MNSIADIHTVSGVEPLLALDGCRSIFGLQKLAVDGCWHTSTKVRTFTARGICTECRWRQHMLDGVSLDQLRTFIAAAEEGSFSAAGRQLRRAQSVVSQTLANLERQTGGKLFDRRGRVPTLTDQANALLSRVRA